MTDHRTQAGPPAAGAFYAPLGIADDGAERFSPTEYTRSVWDTGMQHGSPPAALLVRAIERGLPRDDARITRVTVELLGPVPVTETRVRTRVLRPGRAIELVRAELDAQTPDGAFRTAATATAWRMATADTAAAARATDPPLGGAVAQDSPGFGFFGGHGVTTFLDAVDWAWINQADGAAPGRVRAALRVRLVEGEEPTPLEALFGIVDAANGVGATLDPSQWTFLNTEMTVHLHRMPEAGPLGLAAESSIGPDGVGLCTAVVHDAAGPVARTAQSLLVRARS